MKLLNPIDHVELYKNESFTTPLNTQGALNQVLLSYLFYRSQCLERRIPDIQALSS